MFTDLNNQQIPIPRRRQSNPRRRQQHQQAIHWVSEVLVWSTSCIDSKTIFIFFYKSLLRVRRWYWTRFAIDESLLRSEKIFWHFICYKYNAVLQRVNFFKILHYFCNLFEVVDYRGRFVHPQVALRWPTVTNLKPLRGWFYMNHYYVVRKLIRDFICYNITLTCSEIGTVYVFKGLSKGLNLYKI